MSSALFVVKPVRSSKTKIFIPNAIPKIILYVGDSPDTILLK